MTIAKFIKDKLGLLWLWLSFITLTCLVLWLTPSVNFQLEALIYLVILEGVIFLAYLIISYQKHSKWYHSLRKQDAEQVFSTTQLKQAVTEEQRLAQDYINYLQHAHHVSLKEIISNQQEQKDFIDSWVHEIKIPLASIKLINDTLEDEIAERYFIQMENDLQKIATYVEQVLYYSRLDSFSKDYLIHEVSLKGIISPVMRQNANYFIQHNLHYTIEGDDYAVLTDQKWLGFILNQIISNAIKYTADNGSITLTLSQNDQGTWLKISDNGIGISLADQQRIFDKGFTGQTGRNQTHHSTGLGLYLAKSLTTKLGHHLYVESTEGKGTTLSLLFPHLTYYTSQTEVKLI